MFSINTLAPDTYIELGIYMAVEIKKFKIAGEAPNSGSIERENYNFGKQNMMGSWEEEIKSTLYKVAIFFNETLFQSK